MANKTKIDGKWFWPNGKPGPRIRSAIDRFWDKIKKTPDGCWRWLGSIDDYGYGQFTEVTSNKSKIGGTSRAHVFAFKHFVGPILEGFELHHKCPHTDCSNPEHLEQKTKIDHLKLHHQLQTHCLRGHPLSGENLRLKIKDGSRICRTCSRDYSKRYRENAKKFLVVSHPALP